MPNSIIFNLTIKIEKDVEADWVSDVKNEYLPALVDGINISSAQINKLILGQPEEENTFALQFVFPSQIIFEKEKLKYMERLLMSIDKKYAGKYVYFATQMELIHYQGGVPHNPEISLN